MFLKNNFKLSLLFLMVILLSLTACGVKKQPYPLGDVLPQAPKNLKQSLDADGFFTLSFEAPDKNMLGRPLKDLASFRIEMSKILLTPDFCEGCPKRFVEVETIAAGNPVPGELVPKGVYKFSKKLSLGSYYTFRVYALNKRNLNHPQAWSEINLWALSSPEAPKKFQATLGDNAVLLTWQDLKPDFSSYPLDLKARAKLNVDLERSFNGDDWETLFVSESDLKEKSLTDYNVNYDDKISYRLRQVIEIDDSKIYSPYKTISSLKVEDITAPSPPRNLSAALSVQGVQLSWDESPDDDVAGYNIYRRFQGQENDFKKINVSLVLGLSYLDDQVKEDDKAQYQVTAVDNSPKGNESAFSAPSFVWVVETQKEEDIPERPQPPPLE